MQHEWGILYLFANSGNPNLGTHLHQHLSQVPVLSSILRGKGDINEDKH